VRSVRVGRRVIQQTVAQLGELAQMRIFDRLGIVLRKRMRISENQIPPLGLSA
jgi:hypothetical protein